jgi:hypothetical protein
MVFADWLIDQARPAEAAGLVKVTPKNGDLLFLGFDEMFRRHAQSLGFELAQSMKARGLDVNVVWMPLDSHGKMPPIEQFSEEAMAAMGWVRIGSNLAIKMRLFLDMVCKRWGLPVLNDQQWEEQLREFESGNRQRALQKVNPGSDQGEP